MANYIGYLKDKKNNQLYIEDIYSTEEVKTGSKWIDGKPIYRKVISQVISITAGIENVYNIDLTNLDWVIDVKGMMRFDDFFEPISLVWGNSLNYCMGIGNINSTSYTIVAGGSSNYNDVPIKIILEYTKTTD